MRYETLTEPGYKTNVRILNISLFMFIPHRIKQHTRVPFIPTTFILPYITLNNKHTDTLPYKITVNNDIIYTSVFFLAHFKHSH